MQRRNICNGLAPTSHPCIQHRISEIVRSRGESRKIVLRNDRKFYKLFNSIVSIINILSRGLKMLTRRDYLKYSALLGAACALPGGLSQAFESKNLITRAIPRTGEKLPIVGLGSSATFRKVAQSEDFSALRGVIQTLLDNGGTVFDTAPSYGASEKVSGQIAPKEFFRVRR